MKEVKICKWCKKQFETFRPNQIFCCRECEANFHKAQKHLASHFLGQEWTVEFKKLENEGKDYVQKEA